MVASNDMTMDFLFGILAIMRFCDDILKILYTYRNYYAFLLNLRF